MSHVESAKPRLSSQVLKDETIKVHRFLVASTWVTLIAFTMIFFFQKIWFSFSVGLFGILIINPILWHLMKNGSSAVVRFFFLATCNVYIVFGSFGCNHLIDVDFFLITLTISSVIIFNQEERLYSLLSLSLVLLSGMLLSVDSVTILPSSWVVTEIAPGSLAFLRSLSFGGAFLLSVSYLTFHLQAIHLYHERSRLEIQELAQKASATTELLTKMANNVPGVVYQYRIDTDGNATFPYASTGMKKIYRLDPEVVKKSADPVMKLLLPEELPEVVKSIQDSALTLQPWKYDYRVQFEDGSVEWRRGLAQPQREADGSTLWHGFITDITSEKKLLAELEQARESALHASRLTSLGEMAGGIAHEINSPLMIITSKISLIHTKIKANAITEDELYEELDKLKETVFRIAKIVKGLLTFSRGGGQTEFQLVSLDQVIADVRALCSEKAKSQGIKMTFVCEPDLKIHGNSIQISQVLINLISNSIDAVCTLADPWIEVCIGRTESNRVKFYVRDSGSGLSIEQASRLMQPFFTTKGVGMGTGLGLSISKGLVSAHGGTLEYELMDGHTCFFFELPLLSDESQS